MTCKLEFEKHGKFVISKSVGNFARLCSSKVLRAINSSLFHRLAHLATDRGYTNFVLRAIRPPGRDSAGEFPRSTEIMRGNCEVHWFRCTLPLSGHE